MELPVEPWKQSVMHLVDVSLSANEARVGELIPASLCITTTNAVLCDGQREAPAETFVYDLQYEDSSWLLIGKSRGYFSSTSLQVFRFSLLALRSGLLVYPSATVRRIGHTGTPSEVHIESAARTVNIGFAGVEDVAGQDSLCTK